MQLNKPHKGKIINWAKRECTKGLGYYIIGEYVDHPNMLLNGEWGSTSYIVKHDETTGEIETWNAKYTLIGSGQIKNILSALSEMG